ELNTLGFNDPDSAARHIGDWRSGKARSLRSPPASRAFEAMLPGLMQAIALGADPDHALNRLGDIIERLSSGVNFFRLLEARPRLATEEFQQAHGRIAGGELVILGLGRLGGCALTYASDLDIIYLHTAPPDGRSDGRKPLGPNDYFNRLASRVTASLSVPTAA